MPEKKEYHPNHPHPCYECKLRNDELQHLKKKVGELKSTISEKTGIIKEFMTFTKRIAADVEELEPLVEWAQKVVDGWCEKHQKFRDSCTKDKKKWKVCRKHGIQYRLHPCPRCNYDKAMKQLKEES